MIRFNILSLQAIGIILATITIVRVSTQCAQLNNALAIISGAGKAKGKIFFVQSSPESGVNVSGTIEGLSQGNHGIHVHRYGDLSEGCKSVGPHFDDKNESQHGGRYDMSGHSGDLGNILANAGGTAKIDFTAPYLTLHGDNSIVGRAILVHQRTDDLGVGTNPNSTVTGNVGPAVGCGIIAWDNLNIT